MANQKAAGLIRVERVLVAAIESLVSVAFKLESPVDGV